MFVWITAKYKKPKGGERRALSFVCSKNVQEINIEIIVVLEVILLRCLDWQKHVSVLMYCVLYICLWLSQISSDHILKTACPLLRFELLQY